MKNKLLTGIGIVTLVLGFYLILISNEQPKEASAGNTVRRVNVFGTGTTTPQNVSSAAAGTTTSTFILGGSIDTVDLLFYPENASTTAHVGLQVLISSDDDCATTDASEGSFVDALTTVSSGVITQATTTIQWVPNGTGKKYQLTNVNANCMRILLGQEDVNIYLQAVLKTLSSF